MKVFNDYELGVISCFLYALNCSGDFESAWDMFDKSTVLRENEVILRFQYGDRASVSSFVKDGELYIQCNDFGVGFVKAVLHTMTFTDDSGKYDDLVLKVICGVKNGVCDEDFADAVCFAAINTCAEFLQVILSNKSSWLKEKEKVENVEVH